MKSRSELEEKVQIKNGMLNVYSSGEGKATIVFMSGSGVTSPVLEYKSLYSQFLDKYKVTIVEKSGYGKSNSTGTARTVNNMVYECRTALKNAGIKPPYILAPHSYSGFEAIYWANTYPDEVIAVLSIDMGIPETAIEMAKVITDEKKIKMNEKNKRLYRKIQKRKLLSKLLKKWTVDASGIMSSDFLSTEEKKLYEELFYKNLSNEEMFEESIMMTQNAKTAMMTGKLKVPAYFYISDMKVPLKNTTWRRQAIAYAESIGAEYKLTDNGHLCMRKFLYRWRMTLKNFLIN